MSEKRTKTEELEKLQAIFENIPESKKKVAEKLMENAAFMAEQMELLQEDIEEKGYVSEYQNGANQWGTKKSPEVEVYLSMTKNYVMIVKQLLDIVPDEDKAEDELLAFRRERGIR